MKALVVADGKARDAEIPAERVDSAKERREKLVEAAAETDDDSSRSISRKARWPRPRCSALRKAIAGGKIVPFSPPPPPEHRGRRR